MYENAWQYDAAGNRTQTTARTATASAPNTFSRVSTTLASFSANDWLSQATNTQVTGAAAVSSTTVYGYDRNGAQVGERVDANAARVDAWNFEGHLTQSGVDGQAVSSTNYTTDATGNRVAVAKAGATTSYLVDPNTSYAQVVQEWNKKDNEAAVLQARYVWEDSLAPLVMWRRTTTGAYAPFFTLADGQDSVRQLTDASGAVTDSYHYDAFGQALGGGSGSTPNPFRYTGQQNEGGGRYFLRARYYNTGSGRFLSHDPLMGSSNDPISMHRYLYAANDGINYNDPSGKNYSIGSITVSTATMGHLISMGANGITNVSFDSAYAFMTGQEYGILDAAQSFAVGVVTQGVVSAIGKGLQLAWKTYYAGRGLKVFDVAEFLPHIVERGPRYWATVVQKIRPGHRGLWDSFRIGGFRRITTNIEDMLKKESNKVDVPLDYLEKYMPAFSPNIWSWWKGGLGQHTYQAAGRSHMIQAFSEGIGTIVGFRILQDILADDLKYTEEVAESWYGPGTEE